MATQNFKGNIFLNLYTKEEKFNTCLFPPVTCLFPPVTERGKKYLTLARYFLCLETPGLPACYPLIVTFINYFKAEVLHMKNKSITSFTG